MHAKISLLLLLGFIGCAEKKQAYATPINYISSSYFSPSGKFLVVNTPLENGGGNAVIVYDQELRVAFSGSGVVSGFTPDERFLAIQEKGKETVVSTTGSNHLQLPKTPIPSAVRGSAAFELIRLDSLSSIWKFRTASNKAVFKSCNAGDGKCFESLPTPCDYDHLGSPVFVQTAGLATRSVYTFCVGDKPGPSGTMEMALIGFMPQFGWKRIAVKRGNAIEMKAIALSTVITAYPDKTVSIVLPDTNGLQSITASPNFDFKTAIIARPDVGVPRYDYLGYSTYARANQFKISLSDRERRILDLEGTGRYVFVSTQGEKSPICIQQLGKPETKICSKEEFITSTLPIVNFTQSEHGNVPYYVNTPPNPNGLTVTYIHGGPIERIHAEGEDIVANYYAMGFTIITPLYQANNSSVPGIVDNSFDADSAVDDIEAVHEKARETTGLKGNLILADSFGVYLAAQLAADHPRTDGYILYSGVCDMSEFLAHNSSSVLAEYRKTDQVALGIIEGGKNGCQGFSETPVPVVGFVATEDAVIGPQGVNRFVEAVKNSPKGHLHQAAGNYHVRKHDYDFDLSNDKQGLRELGILSRLSN